MSTIKGQFRCPKCRKNVKECVKANKYVHDFPYVCAPCYNKREQEITTRRNEMEERAWFHMYV
jgi:protein-arginine kinase activator protein McsA